MRRPTPRLALALALGTLAATARLAPADDPPTEGKTDKTEAEDLVPFEKLDVPLRKELWKVCKKFTVRRTVPERRVKCPRTTYEWLLKHLPLASVAARELDLGKYVIEDKGEGKFSIDDAAGAFAVCERVHEEEGRVVIVARGTVESDVIPKTPGTGVIIVRYKPDPADAKQTLTDAFVFFRVTSESLHLASGPFRDKLGGLLGDKLDGLVTCAVKVSEACEKDASKVLTALERSKKVKDEELTAFKRKFIAD